MASKTSPAKSAPVAVVAGLSRTEAVDAVLAMTGSVPPPAEPGRLSKPPRSSRHHSNAPGRVTTAGHGVTDELSCRTKDGTTIPAKISASLLPLGGRSRIVAFVLDVTLRNRAQKALRTSEANFRGLLESSPDGALIATVDACAAQVSDR